MLPGVGELDEQVPQPFRARRRVVAGNLREVERQVVGQQAVLRARFFQRDVVMCFGEFLKIVQVVHRRVMIVLGQSGL